MSKWEICEDGNWYETIKAESMEDALEYAEDNVDRDNYSDAKGTIWVDVRVRSCDTGEGGESTVQLDEDEPECADGNDHDWRSPYSVLGGLIENPGVWGKGGGVIIHECCAHCGKYRVTDTWAQRPDTGEQGLTSVTYEDADEAAMAWVQEIEHA